MAGILKLDQLEEITSDQGIKLSHNLKDPTGNNILTVGSSNVSLGSNVQFPAGHVIQTVYAETSATLTITNTTPPGDVVLSKSITPTFNTSKILVMVQLTYSKEDVFTGYTRLYRNSTWVYPYTADRGFPLRGSSGWGVDIGHIQYLDSPSTTDSTTYNLYAYPSGNPNASTNTSYPMEINRNYNTNQDSASGGRASSSMILMEIAQ